MTQTIHPRSALGAFLAATLLASPAFATNGYFSNGFGPESKAMAGAGVAVGAGVTGLANNPAMGLELGNTASFCLATFRPDRSVENTASGPATAGTFQSANNDFLMGCAGANWVVNDQFSFGALLYGNGGMNTEYDTNFYDGFTPIPGTAPLGVNLEQAFIALNASYRVNDQLTVGAAPILAIQRFAATGLDDFTAFSSDPANVTNNGDDWSNGLGLAIGVLYEPTSELAFGASYRTRIKMDKFDKYAGLFAEQGGFDIPATMTIGAAYTPQNMERLTVTAEVQKIWYGDIKSLANPSTNPANGLGGDNGIGFGWEDQAVYRLAAIWQQSDKLTLRGGVSYGTEVIGEEDTLLNAISPATPQWHVSLGGSYQVNDRWSVTGSYTHAFDNAITGNNPNLQGPFQTTKISMHQHEIALGLNYGW
jgi:long-chain fatty acid transport protein